MVIVYDSTGRPVVPGCEELENRALFGALLCVRGENTGEEGGGPGRATLSAGLKFRSEDRLGMMVGAVGCLMLDSSCVSGDVLLC